MHSNIYSVIVLILSTTVVCRGFKIPSSPEFCSSMIPDSLEGIKPQTSEPPYLLEISHTHIKSGAHFEIYLEPKSKNYTIQGFILQVRNSNTSKAFGVFVRTAETKYYYCNGKKKNVLANCNDKKKKLVTTTWACPPKFKGLVHVICTVIRNEKEYWTGLKSEPITIGIHHGVKFHDQINMYDYEQLSMAVSEGLAPVT